MRQASAQAPKTPDNTEKPEKLDNVESQLNADQTADDELELTIEGDDEPVVVTAKPEAEAEKPVVVEEKKEDEAAALRLQLEQLRNSEAIQKREMERMQQEREAAVAARQKAEQEASRYRLEGEQSNLDAILNAMSAAKAEADAAEQQLEAAIIEQDAKKQAEAHRRLSKAEGNLARLEDGKTELEYRISLLQREKPRVEEKVPEATKAEPQKPAAPDPIESLNVPDRAKEWLREHPDYINNPRLNARLQVAHWDAIEAGHKEFSTGYFAEIEKLVGITKAPPPKVEEAEETDDDVEVDVREPVRTQTKEPRRSAIVSAPVSREAPTSTSTASRTQVRLTKEEADFARMAGITPQEYAKQKLKLQEMKRKGEIQ